MRKKWLIALALVASLVMILNWGMPALALTGTNGLNIPLNKSSNGFSSSSNPDSTGMSTGNVKIMVAPTITSISPNHGKQGETVPVTIYGTNFNAPEVGMGEGLSPILFT